MTTETMSLLERKYAKRFEMFDVDGNGVLERTDFGVLANRLVEGLGVTAGDRPGFKRVIEPIARLNLDEILEALCDFYVSGDPNAPGNLLSGKL